MNILRFQSSSPGSTARSNASGGATSSTTTTGVLSSSDSASTNASGTGPGTALSVPLPTLPKNLTRKDLADELRRTRERQRALNAELDKLVRRRNEVEATIDALVRNVEFPEPNASAHPGPEPENERQPQVCELTTDTDLPESLDRIYEEAAVIAHQISKETHNARSLSKTVNLLDAAQTATKVALTRISTLLGITEAARDIRASLDKLDLKDAATLIHSALNTPLVRDLARMQSSGKYGEEYASIEGTANQSNVASVRALEQLAREALNALVQAMDEALRNEDWRMVIELAGLYPLLGRPHQGLNYYCLAVRKRLLHDFRARNLVDPYAVPHDELQLQDSHGERTPYADVLTQILLRITTALHSHGPIIQQLFGKGTHFRLTQELFDVADEFAKFVIDLMLDSKIITLAKQCSERVMNYRPTGATAGGSSTDKKSDNDPIDPRKLDPILQSISVISASVEAFEAELRYVAEKARNLWLKSIDKERQEREKMGSDNSPDWLERYSPSTPLKLAWDEGLQNKTLPQVSELLKSAQTLIGHFISLEVGYLVQNMYKAESLDMHALPPPRSVALPLAATQSPSATSKSAQGKEASLDDLVASAPVINFDIMPTPIPSIPIFLKALSQSTTRPTPEQLLDFYQYRFSVSLTSTVVDDILYVVKKSLDRAFATNNPGCVCALMNHVSSALHRDLRGMFIHALSSYAQSFGQGSAAEEILGMALELNAAPTNSNKTGMLLTDELRFGGMVGGVTALSQGGLRRRKVDADTRLLVTINNLDACITNLSSLQQHVRDEFQRVFSPERAMAALIAQAIEEMDGILAGYRTLLKKAVHMLAGSSLPRISTLLQQFLQTPYDINEEKFQDYASNDPWAAEFVTAVNAELAFVRPCLSDAAFTAYAVTIVSVVTRRVESCIYSLKRVSSWGALQLDKDVRTILGALQQVLSPAVGVRDRFTKLQQITLLLQVDSARDVVALLSDVESSAGTWRPTLEETRAALMLRVELNKDEIKRLHFTKMPVKQ